MNIVSSQKEGLELDISHEAESCLEYYLIRLVS